MMFSWFDVSKEVVFANKLAEYFDREWRTLERKTSQKQSDKRQKLIAQVFTQAQQFGITHKPNIYKKSKLGNTFKWRLVDLGYSKELIDSLTKDILLAMR